jgi:predicted nucleotidyltransferase
MKTRIISAFPGTGKTYFYNKNKETTMDSDSSQFSGVKDQNGNNTKERNPNFPKNYIEHIKENIGKYEFILVSSHKEVRNALKDMPTEEIQITSLIY